MEHCGDFSGLTFSIFGLLTKDSNQKLASVFFRVSAMLLKGASAKLR